MCSDREHRNTTALSVEQTVDQVQVARPAATDAHREFAGQCRLRRRGECGTFLVARVDPFEPLILAQCVGESVQRVAGDSVDPPYSGSVERLDDVVGHGSCHVHTP
ncbi:Uncharacterised protein [Mycobacteroides abscessus subsp. abscessus]|nr:Uncharacterised protein [Mycobacteroides abscessus subsp. abscessus]